MKNLIYIKPRLHNVVVNGIEDLLDTAYVTASDQDTDEGSGAGAKTHDSTHGYTYGAKRKSSWGDLWGSGHDPYNTAQ